MPKTSSAKTLKEGESRVIAALGDINPLRYDGGFVIETAEEEDHRTLAVEYAFQPPDDDSKWQPEYDRPFEGMPYQLYVVDVTYSIQYGGSDHENIEDCMGLRRGELKRLSKSANVMDRVRAVEAIAGYWGWDSLVEPITLTAEDLIERWKQWVGEVSLNPLPTD